MAPKANYQIVIEKSADDKLVINDIGPWPEYMTVTNCAEQVVEELYEKGLLPPGRKLYYYDSDGNLDELLHDGAGRFQGFGGPFEEE